MDNMRLFQNRLGDFQVSHVYFLYFKVILPRILTVYIVKIQL